MNKTVVIRGLCLLVLVASIAVRFQANRAREAMIDDFDVAAAVTDVIRQHGYALRDNPVRPPGMLSHIIYFQRPECDQVSLVLPHFINEETQSLLTRAASADVARRFFYLDGSWNDQARVAMFLAWVKYAVLDIVGTSRYIPVKQAIVVAEGRDCHPAADIDWRQVWAKERRSASKSGIGVAAPHLGT
jgi:hypothetical protein